MLALGWGKRLGRVFKDKEVSATPQARRQGNQEGLFPSHLHGYNLGWVGFNFIAPGCSHKSWHWYK